MTYGYSQRLVDAIQNDDSKSLDVALGKFVIRNNIPVTEVSQALGVSRMTIYNWLLGITHPSRDNGTKIIGWMRAYKKAQKDARAKAKNVPL
jgi:predicted DNA-binding transcriptional regulator AlpA